MGNAVYWAPVTQRIQIVIALLLIGTFVVALLLFAPSTLMTR